MKHVRAGQETVNTLERRIPEQTRIGGQVYINFRDILFNLVINNLQHIDANTVSKKIQNYSIQRNTLSPKHRRRIEKQLKRVSGLKK